jgi:hypothetical protein
MRVGFEVRVTVWRGRREDPNGILGGCGLLVFRELGWEGGVVALVATLLEMGVLADGFVDVVDVDGVKCVVVWAMKSERVVGRQCVCWRRGLDMAVNIGEEKGT